MACVIKFIYLYILDILSMRDIGVTMVHMLWHNLAQLTDDAGLLTSPWCEWCDAIVSWQCCHADA